MKISFKNTQSIGHNNKFKQNQNTLVNKMYIDDLFSLQQRMQLLQTAKKNILEQIISDKSENNLPTYKHILSYYINQDIAMCQKNIDKLKSKLNLSD